MRRLVINLVVALLLAACGGSTGTPSPAPTPAPSVSPSPAPTASPTAATAAPSAGSSGSSAFVLSGLAPALGPNDTLPDASTFATTFASETPAIYVVYQLAPGVSGTVKSTWDSAGGGGTFLGSFDYPTTAPWAYFRLTFDNGFIPGAHQEVLSFASTGETITLPFTVSGPRKSPSPESPRASGPSAFTLLRMATAADASKSAPDPSTYTSSFSTTDPAVYVVFTLGSGLTGTVTCAMTANGSVYIQPLSLSYGSGNSWGDFKITPSGTFPAGNYVATLTFTPTGESETISFTVN